MLPPTPPGNVRTKKARSGNPTTCLGHLQVDLVLQAKEKAGRKTRL
jgi:hypothetical protein